jgi:hypothetical protein
MTRSLRATVLRLAAVAAVAAVLIWSLLYLDLLRSSADAVPAQQSGRQTGLSDSRPAPAPVTTRTS